MKPPICVYCQKDFRKLIGNGGLLTFQLSRSEKEYNKRFNQKEYVGHPKGKAWFCDEHYKLAKSLTHLTLGETLKKCVYRENPILLNSIFLDLCIIKRNKI